MKTEKTRIRSPLGGADLSLRQSVAEAAADAHGRKAHAAGTPGQDPRAELHLCSLEPAHQKIRPRRDLRVRSRSRCPAVVGNTYLEGTYGEIYPDISQDEAGLRSLFVQFS